MSHVEKTKTVYVGANLTSLLIAFAIGISIWLIPRPADIDKNAWQLLAIFAGLIAGLIGKALPMGGISFLALTILLVTNTLTMKEAFSGFSHPIIWLVIASFFIAKAFIKTGLGMRLAYHFVALFGKKTLSLCYSISATELLLAPAIPSATARAGGIIFPIVKSLAVSFGSTPERHSQRLIGSYLILTAYYINLVTSAMFITAMAANPLIVAIFQDFGINVTWGSWALAASVPGIICIITVPYIIYKLYPPEIKDTPEAAKMAHTELNKMGSITTYEWITFAVFVMLIFLWIFGENLFGLEGTTVALMGVSILMITGVLTWDDIKKEHEAWDTLIWFSTLLMMAGFLNSFGLTKWFSNHIQLMLEGTSVFIAFPFLVFIYFFSHYFFASNTAHITSMFAAFLSVGIAIGAPPYLIAFSLAFSSSLFSCLTHYGTGCAPILFGSEYVNLKTWWKIGAIMGVYFLFVFVGIGSLWWKVLGLW